MYLPQNASCFQWVTSPKEPGALEKEVMTETHTWRRAQLLWVGTEIKRAPCNWRMLQLTPCFSLLPPPPSLRGTLSFVPSYPSSLLQPPGLVWITQRLQGSNPNYREGGVSNFLSSLHFSGRKQVLNQYVRYNPIFKNILFITIRGRVFICAYKQRGKKSDRTQRIFRAVKLCMIL